MQEVCLIEDIASISTRGVVFVFVLEEYEGREKESEPKIRVSGRGGEGLQTSLASE